MYKAFFEGKEFFSGCVSLLDGVIEEVHTKEEADAVNNQPLRYFSPGACDRMGEGESAYFWVELGVVQYDWNGPLPDKVLDNIYNQIKIKQC